MRRATSPCTFFCATIPSNGFVGLFFVALWFLLLRACFAWPLNSLSQTLLLVYGSYLLVYGAYILVCGAYLLVYEAYLYENFLCRTLFSCNTIAVPPLQPIACASLTIFLSFFIMRQPPGLFLVFQYSKTAFEWSFDSFSGVPARHTQHWYYVIFLAAALADSFQALPVNPDRSRPVTPFHGKL